VLRKQQAELAARQEAQKAAAAKAAAERAAAPRPPPYDANGSLVHLHRGKAELDDILRQTGALLHNQLAAVTCACNAAPKVLKAARVWTSFM
jgi:D-serine deaminase-like pyridoxal phosphate-dependent protein